jgi:hypothetical protein
MTDNPRSTTEWVECICGASIQKVESFTGAETTWVDHAASPYCYPESKGRDGEAHHEPLEAARA